MASSQTSKQDGDVSIEARVLSFPNIVKHIFVYLPARPLCRVSRVCKLWKHEADLTLRQRRQYYWELFEVLAHKDCTAVLINLEQFVRDLPVRPSLILVFSTDKLWKKKFSSSIGCSSSAKRKRKHSLADRLANIVPPHCKIICSSTYGIIGTSSNLAHTKEIEKSDGVTLICFGRHPGLEFVPFDLNPELFQERMEHWNENSTDRELAMQRGDFAFLPPCPDMKAMLMCCNEICDPKIGTMLYNYLKKPLIAGGFVNNLSTNSYSYKECLSGMNIDYLELGDNEYLSCLGISGDNVHAASVMFPPYLSTKEDADAVVQSLKEKSRDFPLSRCIAFMFACVARGRQCYGSYNVESAAFRRHFPTVPVFGFFGNGEIGFEYPRVSESYAHVCVEGNAVILTVLMAFVGHAVSVAHRSCQHSKGESIYGANILALQQKAIVLKVHVDHVNSFVRKGVT